MNIKVNSAIACAAISLTVLACNGSKDNPKTADKDDLNPPGNLMTVTGSKQIELRWTAGNVEDDFQGYYVFATKKAAIPAAYPAGVDIATSGIPRCADNSTVFEAFGAPASDKDCEGDADQATDGDTDDAASNFAEETTDSTDSDEPALTGWVECQGHEDAALSLPAPAPQTGVQKCVVTKDKDGNDLVDGETYMFVVVGVMEDDLSVVSWSSNIVYDTPSTTALTADDDTALTLATDKSIAIEFDMTAKTATAQAAIACGNVSTSPQCDLDASNDLATGVPTIWLSRDAGSSSHPQRIFVSTSSAAAASGHSVQLQPRGPQVWDGDSLAARIPQDHAVTTFADGGQQFAVYNNQVFDFAIEKGSETFYGKLVIGDVTYADQTGTDDQNKLKDATVQAWVILQPTAGVTDYFMGQ